MSQPPQLNVTPSAPTASIISVSEAPSANPDRRGKFDLTIFYQVGNHVFQTTIPAENATHELEIAAIRNDYSKKKNLVGNNIVQL